jgi:hypothetical protein
MKKTAVRRKRRDLYGSDEECDGNDKSYFSSQTLMPDEFGNSQHNLRSRKKQKVSDLEDSLEDDSLGYCLEDSQTIEIAIEKAIEMGKQKAKQQQIEGEVKTFFFDPLLKENVPTLGEEALPTEREDSFQDLSQTSSSPSDKSSDVESNASREEEEEEEEEEEDPIAKFAGEKKTRRQTNKFWMLPETAKEYQLACIRSEFHGQPKQALIGVIWKLRCLRDAQQYQIHSLAEKCEELRLAVEDIKSQSSLNEAMLKAISHECDQAKQTIQLLTTNSTGLQSLENEINSNQDVFSPSLFFA